MNGLYYRFRSELDGTDCVLVFTGFARKSANTKTGPMIQTWIMRADIDPKTASTLAMDGSVCGECPLRRSLDGACYVTIERAPLAVWKAWDRGAYDALDLDDSSHVTALRRLPLRLGSYGDPAAVPASFWSALFSTVRPKRWAGYTHQWKDGRFRALRRWIMASCDSPSDLAHATSRGWRGFLVVPADTVDAPVGTIWCPAAPEGGSRLTCSECSACSGSRRSSLDQPSIAIRSHGQKAIRFVPVSEVSVL